MNRVRIPVRQRKLAWRQIIIVENSKYAQLTSRSYTQRKVYIKLEKENFVKKHLTAWVVEDAIRLKLEYSLVWWNWQTQRSQTPLLKSIWVRVPSPAPNIGATKPFRYMPLWRLTLRDRQRKDRVYCSLNVTKSI